MHEPNDWLQRFADSHRELTYPALYWAAVPMVVLGSVGLLWIVPIPAEYARISPLLNWGSTFLMAAAVYYFIISVPLAIGMLPFVIGVAAFQAWLGTSDYAPLRVSAGLLLAGTLGLWIGRRRQWSFGPVWRDLQMMMIGPAWLLSVLYRRIGIPI
ncbi:MAG: hypothetical protein OEW64_05855 [Gammaproteobacteria bacterium]|nr:hypothetical protein [Gammaproteobacteria bacterium]MDH5303602.1 hypothetical protein [Gammaproteobacteria bacterium]MDH5322811.1 hypothetical protein [Gammaproteobacteria bacterium]